MARYDEDTRQFMDGVAGRKPTVQEDIGQAGLGIAKSLAYHNPKPALSILGRNLGDWFNRYGPQEEKTAAIARKAVWANRNDTNSSSRAISGTTEQTSQWKQHQ